MNPNIRTLVILVVSAIAGSPSVTHAQSYLEKLEALVEKAKRDAESGELPPPKDKDTIIAPVPAPSPAANQNPPRTPPGASILEPAAEPGAEPATAASSAGAVSESTGRVFLGLEAEKPPGGGLGVRVSKVTENSPAWKAGFHVGDRILAINGFGIADLEAMGERMQLTRPGQPCEFLITRNDRTLPLTAVLMDAELAGRIFDNPPSPGGEGKPWLGTDVSDLTPLFRDQFGIKVFAGAAVTSVDRNSPAAKAGIKPGDCIVELGGAPVGRANDFKVAMARRRPGESIDLIVHRGAFPKNLRVTLELDPTDRGRTPARSDTDVRGGAASVVTPSPPNAVDALPAGRSPNIASQPTSQTAQQRIAELEQEVKQLTEQVRTTQAQLRESELKLNQLVERLGKQP